MVRRQLLRRARADGRQLEVAEPAQVAASCIPPAGRGGPPFVMPAARQQTILGGTDWGMLQAGITISIIPCVLFYLLLQKYYVAGFLSGAVK